MHTTTFRVCMGETSRTTYVNMLTSRSPRCGALDKGLVVSVFEIT